MNSDTDNQVDMFPKDENGGCTVAPWMGLVMDHRRLFDALQDGWLRPLPPRTGVLVGVGAYAIERAETSSGHPIFIHIKLDHKKLPSLDVTIHRKGCWVFSRLDALEPSDKMLYWIGSIPAFAFSEYVVDTEEERIRLAVMAKQSSNIDLPKELIRVGHISEEDVKSDTSPPDIASKFVVPANEDSIRGAMTMAIWAVPRVAPWLEILTAGLACNQKRLPELADVVDAGWWRFPPWVTSQDMQPFAFQDSLWLAASSIFRTKSGESGISSRELAERIAATTASSNCTNDAEQASSWLNSTLDILRASSIIRFDDWRTTPVGIAIQLVLTRREPTTFRTWFKELPNLAPAIGWSAAVLCGLLHGYRRLDTQFRGETFQQEILAIHALRTCAVETRDIDWPCLSSSAMPKWRRESGDVVLFWGDEEFARKPEKVRGRWHSADFADAKVVRVAQEVVEKMDWRCMTREICCKDVQLLFSGPGTVHVPAESQSQIHVKGEVQIRLPSGVVIDEVLDVESFRRLVATEAVLLPEPPTTAEVPGLIYVCNFLSESEEEELVREIDLLTWKTDLPRRVQHYGWRYDYKARKVDPSMYIGPLPEWAKRIAERLVSNKLVPQLPDQLIVNEYVGAQGIGKHSDSKSFADGIAMISLLESWEMIFREKFSKDKNKGKSTVGQMLERRSVAVMHGPARSRWTHEIPKRKNETNNKSQKVPRGRRISLTFRKVIVPGERGREPG